jgi:hypothetical protein
MQGASALGAEIVDQDAICDRQAHAFRERMLVEIGQKPENVRGSLCLAELGEVRLHEGCSLDSDRIYLKANIILSACQALRLNIILQEYSGDHSMIITSEQIKAARSLLRWEQQALCDASKVSLATIKNIERKPGLATGNAPTLNAIVRALEEAGVELIPENGGGAGVRLRKGDR